MSKKNILRYEMKGDQLAHIVRKDPMEKLLEVGHNQMAVLLYNGEVGDVFGSGFHKLHTGTLKRYVKHAEYAVFFIRTSSTTLDFGMDKPVYIGHEMIKLRALGEVRLRIVEPVLMIERILKENGDFRTEAIMQLVAGMIENELSVFFRTYHPMKDLFFDIKKTSVALKTWLNKLLSKWGCYIDVLTLKHLTMPDDVVADYARYKPCPMCKEMISPDDVTCSSCGSSIARQCETCGRVVEGNFCPDCGTPSF